MNTVGERLQLLRRDRGSPPPSQAQVATAVGVSVRSYGAWERDAARPSFESAQAIAPYFDTTAEWILYGAQGTDAERLVRIEEKLDEVLTLLRKRKVTR